MFALVFEASLAVYAVYAVDPTALEVLKITFAPVMLFAGGMFGVDSVNRQSAWGTGYTTVSTEVSTEYPPMDPSKYENIR